MLITYKVENSHLFSFCHTEVIFIADHDGGKIQCCVVIHLWIKTLSMTTLQFW